MGDTFNEASVPAGNYHTSLSSPGSFFSPFDHVVTSWSDIRESIDNIIEKFGSVGFRWRGQKDSKWGLYSSLYRYLLGERGISLPGETEISVQHQKYFPTESDMVNAEHRILNIARSKWRFDHLPALEIFARLQHFGGPTRLIDVTSNPYVALWFAVEANTQQDEESDARLFALGTKTMNSTAAEAFELTEENSGRIPNWHSWNDLNSRMLNQWGTGKIKRVWRPPAYEQRILSQNASFLIDGLPIYSPQIKQLSRRGFDASDFYACTSVFTRTYTLQTDPKDIDPEFAPNFCFLIPAEQKKVIRDQLSEHFGFSMSSVYPDMMGLSDFLLSTQLED